MITRVEGWIDAAEAELPKLTNFILPGGSPAAAARDALALLVRLAGPGGEAP